jgi:glyoxylase-like metal-dependent hydrolase (beta-lactamase superfamily II)
MQEEYRLRPAQIYGAAPASLRDFPSRRRILPMTKLISAIAGLCVAATLTAAPQQPRWTVHAVRYATLPFPVSSLIANLPEAERDRRLDIAMMVWVLRGPDNRVVLVDAGFYRDKFMQRYKPAGYSKPSEAVQAGLGIAPEDVTDIIISHIHWDHADGTDLFPRAKVWIQRDEYTHHIDDTGKPLDRAIDADVAAMLKGLNDAGRVEQVDGDDKEIMPGIRVYIGGKHTFQSQYVGVATRSGTIIVASDNVYLYENLERRLPIAQTLSPQSNLAAQARMLNMAASLNRIVPGHDPTVFERFTKVKDGVVRID